MNRRRGGFTLIEILVSIAIFAVLAALSYGTMNQIITSADEGRFSHFLGNRRGF